MPLPPVVIELSAADAASAHAGVMVAACTQAVADGECQTAVSDPADARAIAMVSWDPARTSVRIELGVKSGGSTRWVSRRLDFRDGDPEIERWRSVGLVVGTLVGEAEQEVERTRVAESPKPGPTPSPPAARTIDVSPTVPPPARPSLPPTRLWLGVEAVVGPALDDGSWRTGAGVLALYDFPRAPVLGVGALRYVARPADDRDVAARWFGLSFGLGLHHAPLPQLRLEVRGEALVERMDASVGGRRRDDAGRWYPGGRLVLGAGARVGDWVTFVFAGEFTGLSQGTVITLEDEVVGRAPPLTWALGLGVRLRVF